MAEREQAQPAKLDYARPTLPLKTSWAGLVLLLLACALVLIIIPSWPSSNTAKETARRVRCASNLRTIGQAVVLYANGHDGQYPDSLGTILLNVPITADVLICESSSDSPAKGATTRAVVADLSNGSHSSYIYVGKGLTTSSTSSKTIVAYEPLNNHSGNGANVLYGDGHVEFLNAQPFKMVIASLAPATQSTQ